MLPLFAKLKDKSKIVGCVVVGGALAASAGQWYGIHEKKRGGYHDYEADLTKHSSWTLPNLSARGLKLNESEIHGLGLYSVAPVPKRFDICLVKRWRCMNPTDIAGYINHAVTQPNCTITKRNDGSLWLTSDEAIRAEEELLVNYNQHAKLAHIETAEQANLPGLETGEYSRQHHLLVLRQKLKNAPAQENESE
jgi:hypothetical protein